MFGKLWKIKRRLALSLAAGAMALTAGIQPVLAGYADIVVDARSGRVISGKNSDTLNHPASLTKMMTLYLTFEALHSGRLRWDQRIPMTRNAARTIPTKLGIAAGKTLTVREAVNGMIIKSANDAAEAMGDYLGGSEQRFAQIMTSKARMLGMRRTVFRNASGLPSASQVTTARDMAVLALALQRDFPTEYKLFSRRSFAFRGRTIRGHNNLMYRYKGMDGIKTGYTAASGFNIVSAVHDNGRSVVGVVLGEKSARKRDDRMAALLNAAMKGRGDRATQIAALDVRPAKKRAASPALALLDPDQQNSVADAAPATVKKKLALAAKTEAYPVAAPLKSRKTTLARADAPPTTLEAKAALLSAGVETEIDDAPTASTSHQTAGIQDGWEVQVAAAASPTQAIKMATRAGHAIAGDFPGLGNRTEPVKSGGKILHRARLTGFDDRKTAQAACSALKARAYDCVVVN